MSPRDPFGERLDPGLRMSARQSSRVAWDVFQQRTLERFAGQLRDAVDLDAVGGLLAAVAGQTVRPASASVWVRGRTS